MLYKGCALIYHKFTRLARGVSRSEKNDSSASTNLTKKSLLPFEREGFFLSSFPRKSEKITVELA